MIPKDSPAAPGTKDTTAAAAAREAGPAGTVPQAEIPAQEEPQTAAATELIYREEAEKLPQSAQTAPRPAAQPQTRQETTAEAAAREVGHAGTVPQAAIPAREDAPADAPAELIYREEAGETAQTVPYPASQPQPQREPRRASPTAQQIRERADERRAVTEPTEPYAAAAIPRGGAPEQETGASEAEPAAELALPAEPEARTEAPAQLVFREDTEETPPRGAERPAVPLPARTVRSDAAARQAAMQAADGRSGQTPHTVPQTLRDIRVASPHDAESIQSPERIAEAIPAPEPTPTAEQPELYFAAAGQTEARAAEDAPARPTQKPAREEKTELPGWAKELLERSGVTDTASQTVVFSSAADAAKNARQINWSAPVTANPIMQRSRDGSGPADLTFKERGEAEETPYKPQISDAELQRTADKVYRMIEERLRRELRRSGR